MAVRKGLFVVVGLFLFSQAVNGATTDAARNFTKISADYFDWRMSERPESSTSRGYHRYNDILDSVTLNGFNSSKVKAEEFLARLKEISRDQLSTNDKLSYDILENMLMTYISGFEWRLYNAINPINMLEGPQHSSEYFNTYLPFYTIGDYENYLSRLTRLPHQFDELLDLFREAVRLGRTYHNVSIIHVFGQIENVEKNCPPSSNNYTSSCGYYIPFTEALDKTSIDQATRTSLRSRGVQAIQNIMAKYAEITTFLREVYMPASRPGYGVWSLDKGREFYQACLKWHLSIDLSAEEVHEIGKQEVARIHGQMKKIMEKNQFEGTVADYFKLMKNDSNQYYSTSEEFLQGYRDLITGRVDPHLDQLFNDIPELPLEVRATPNDGMAGYYTLGSKDGSIPGIFWANVMHPNTYPKFNMPPLTMHEANPGHHMQLSYNLLSDSPKFRSNMEYFNLYEAPFAMPSYTAFVEGWALYAEYLGEELKIYKDDYELMGRYSSEIFRACRLVVDTGIHHYNWSRQAAIDYLLTYTAEPETEVVLEIDRYITWPGQACSYKIGELKIMEMRKFAQEKLGDKFDLSGFHTSLMKAGSVPLDLMERNIKEWVDDQLNSTPESSPPTCSSQINSVPSAVFYILFFGLMFELCCNL